MKLMFFVHLLFFEDTTKPEWKEFFSKSSQKIFVTRLFNEVFSYHPIISFRLSSIQLKCLNNFHAHTHCFHKQFYLSTNVFIWTSFDVFPNKFETYLKSYLFKLLSFNFHYEKIMFESRQVSIEDEPSFFFIFLSSQYIVTKRCQKVFINFDFIDSIDECHFLFFLSCFDFLFFWSKRTHSRVWNIFMPSTVGTRNVLKPKIFNIKYFQLLRNNFSQAAHVH